MWEPPAQKQTINYFQYTKKYLIIATSEYLFVLEGNFRGIKAGQCLKLSEGKLYKFDVKAFRAIYAEELLFIEEGVEEDA